MPGRGSRDASGRGSRDMPPRRPLDGPKRGSLESRRRGVMANTFPSFPSRKSPPSSASRQPRETAPRDAKRFSPRNVPQPAARRHGQVHGIRRRWLDARARRPPRRRKKQPASGQLLRPRGHQDDLLPPRDPNPPRPVPRALHRRPGAQAVRRRHEVSGQGPPSLPNSAPQLQS